MNHESQVVNSNLAPGHLFGEIGELNSLLIQKLSKPDAGLDKEAEIQKLKQK